MTTVATARRPGRSRPVAAPDTGAKGVFDVEVDGELLYSKHATGRHAHPGEVLELFRERYATDVTPYGE